MFGGRIQQVKQKLLTEKIDGVLVSDATSISYLSGYANFSKEEREAYIFVGSDFAYLISDARYTEEVRNNVPHLTLFERSHTNPLENLFKKHQVKILGIEENNLTVTEHKLIKKHFKKTAHFEVSRSIKTKEEIEKIEKACKIGDLAFKYILKKLKSGVTEKEIAEELKNFIRSKGVVISFPPIVAFGKNAAVPHHQTGQTKLTKNDGFALLDFGAKLNDYCSDMTRTVFLGQPTNEQKKIYETVQKAQQEAVDYINSAIKSGTEVLADQADKAARDYIISQGYPAIPHSLGHGIGLEVHEAPHISPKSKGILIEGMVFSIEPGIYIPGFGGVRIEDLFVLEDNGLRKLTHASVKPKVI